MSEERRHTGDQDEFMRDAFNNWDAGEPADQWKELDESLSLDSVWSRIDQTMVDQTNTVDNELRSAFDTWEPEMEADGWNRLDHAIPDASNTMDSELRASYDSWQPAAANDGWNKLNDALSIEQVWVQLQQTLELPVTTRIPFAKLIAATIAMLFMITSLYDTPVPVQEQRSSEIALLEGSKSSGRTAAPDNVDQTTGQDRTTNDLLAEQPFNEPRQQTDVQLPSDEQQIGTQQQDLVNNEGSRSSDEQSQQTTDNTNVEPDAASDILATVDPLDVKGLNTSIQPLAEQHFRVIPRFSPWTIQVGTQLSSLREADQSRLTSFRPRFGMAADISFRHRLGPVQLIHAFGMSQYSQDVGKYNNGRYTNMRQHINSIQLSSSVGYSYRRYTVYGGLLFSNVLNGLEQNQYNAVTNVYNFKAIQLGLTTGVDVRLLTLPSIGKQISLGVQYQWIPNLEGPTAAFDHIHGIRIQTKFSF